MFTFLKWTFLFALFSKVFFFQSMLFSEPVLFLESVLFSNVSFFTKRSVLKASCFFRSPDGLGVEHCPLGWTDGRQHGPFQFPPEKVRNHFCLEPVLSGTGYVLNRFCLERVMSGTGFVWNWFDLELVLFGTSFVWNRFCLGLV